ncbi:MAG: porphobilinogen synthase [Candidatus Nanopelagicales bacterium]|nr:porphobilinogen synthase [Candidatus Nanopelagicales bacterium]
MYVQQESSDRPRRLRSTPAVRRLMAEVRVHPASLVQPLFVAESIEHPDPIPSMPGVVRHTLESGAAAVRRAADAGVGGVMLFGVPEHLDSQGSGADDPDGILNRAIGMAVDAAGDDLVVMADTCLDAFTDHGHCGVLSADGSVDNDATLRRYADIAAAQALAGAEVLGLSGMMDGQVAAVRAALDGAGRPDVAILAYAAKYASAWYGPFREAVSSQLSGDRRTYQMDPANRREAMREAGLDLAEGADILMVKPALGYLDVLADVAASADLPVWAYQVSGEYAAIEAAAANGWLDRDALMLETVLGIRRAGASAVLTYWATELAERLST